jgi:hypothetical protein
MNIKQKLRPIIPDWRRIILFIILFLVLPQKVSNDFIFFGGVFIIRSLFESLPPNLDLNITAIILIASYFISCLVIWLYDSKINTFILSEGEVDVNPPEKSEKIYQKPAKVKEEEK